MASKGLDFKQDKRDKLIVQLKKDKQNTVNEYIKLKSIHQKLFFQYKEQKKVTQLLQKKVCDLESENERLVNKNKELSTHANELRRKSVSKPSKKVLEEKEYEVEEILRHRKMKTNIKYLVHWKGYTSKDDSWIPEKDLCCPQLLDKYKIQNNL